MNRRKFLSRVAGLLASVPLVGRVVPKRLVANWRGRIVLAGEFAETPLWYMSDVGDPSEWECKEAGYPLAVVLPTIIGTKVGADNAFDLEWFPGSDA